MCARVERPSSTDWFGLGLGLGLGCFDGLLYRVLNRGVLCCLGLCGILGITQRATWRWSESASKRVEWNGMVDESECKMSRWTA